MRNVQRRHRRRTLIFERNRLVSERVRDLLGAEQFETCAVDDPELFDELRGRIRFELFVIGIERASDLEALADISDARPLVLLAPLRRTGSARQLRMALPDALLVDRQLRDKDALRAVLEPESAVPSPEVPDAVRQAFEPFGLTERQLEVVRHALLGGSSAEIARLLFISEPTVRNHLHAIYDRVRVSGRRELLGRFVRGLLEPAA